jgi:hypothetical protein
VTGAPEIDRVARLVLTLFFGLCALAWGIGGYLLVLYTTCFTFNFTRPVWNSIKAKKYITNIMVNVGFSVGIGLMLAVFLSPLLTAVGLPASQANLLVIMAVIIVFQLLQLWFLMWSPLETRIITKRLAAMGIPREQLSGAVLVGLSNPASGIVKRFGAIEEDMGALWIAPDRLAFRGDVEQFDLTRDMIAEIERRGDNRSTTTLAGIAHVILHVRLADGSIRQIRLHTEGLWTMGKKRRAMDALADAINQWYAAAPAA